ncbi:MAG TPA: phosphate ABC transporter permease subunit PstC [Roseiarcus sp.]|nr:phosphate ABC transporter permease subunit PstC [Roseiarcus sp.]
MDRARALGRLKFADGGFRWMTLLSALLVLILLVGVAISLFIGSWPAFKTFGFGFFFSDAWSPPKERFGAAAAIYGTLVTSIIAMLIGVPVGLGIAVFLTELCPPALRRPIGVAIELLAGIPSIIYGIWGVYYFKPVMQAYVQPFIIGTFGAIPGIGSLFAGPPLGYGVLTAGLVLAVMILPFVTAVSRDVFETVPAVLKEAAYGVGATTFEVVGNIVIPYTRVGVIGGVMLALGRALGETMAVTFVIGNATKISASILAQGTTISAMIANQFADADPGLFTSSLLALGFILFIITFLVLAAARWMLARLEVKA